MKIFEKVNAHTKRVRSSSLTGITVSAGAPAGAFGVSYMVNQNASQTSPARPTNANADCQPVRRIRYATIGGARIAPTADPLLNSPAASARSLSGNHSAPTFTAPGQFPASPMPSRNRNTPRLNVPRAHACSAAAMLHHATHRSEEHTSELQSLRHLVCRLLLE